MIRQEESGVERDNDKGNEQRGIIFKGGQASS